MKNKYIMDNSILDIHYKQTIPDGVEPTTLRLTAVCSKPTELWDQK